MAAKTTTHLVSWSSGQDELAVRVEGQTVDLCRVGVYDVTGFGRVVGPRVPSVQHQNVDSKSPQKHN